MSVGVVNQNIPAVMEKPNHNVYMKLFRVDQCQLFLGHKCLQHKPYKCFNFHFRNQRRRKPLFKNGSFNYGPYEYCSKFNEATGSCPDGDNCPLLHKTVGDTEKLYHPILYKTIMCPHITNADGSCFENGFHCPFAHGESDLRKPCYDLVDALPAAINGNNEVLNKLYGIHADDPKWRSPFFVYTFYKTIPCEMPFSCRRGYTCPLYHDSTDKRRSPQTYRYGYRVCKIMRDGDDDWKSAAICHKGNECTFCHTRTEQQFHIDIYKSSKCKDIAENGHCPRGIYCAFSHSDMEVQMVKSIRAALKSGQNLRDIYNSY